MLARASTVDDAGHDGLGVYPVAGVRDLERDDQPLAGERRISRANHQAGGGQIDDAVGNQLKIPLSDDLADQANRAAGGAGGGGSAGEGGGEACQEKGMGGGRP